MEHVQTHKNLEDIRKGAHAFVDGHYVSTVWIPQDYPKWKYHPTLPAVTVADKAAEEALGEGWYDTKPAAEKAAKEVLTMKDESADADEAPKKRGPKPKVTEQVS